MQPSKLKKIKYSAVALLSLLTCLHMRIFFFAYFEGSTTLVTNVQFYNKTHPLKFPNILVCISKVYTYSKLRTRDIAHLYEMSGSLSSKLLDDQQRSKYDWNVELNDIILNVSLDGHFQSPGSIFQSVFGLIGEQCWETTIDQFSSGQAGRIHTFDLIINAAVYDDLILNHPSPITYVRITPFNSIHDSGDNFIPDLANSIYASPGRFSSIGLSKETIDSSVRSSLDETICHSGTFSKDHCIVARRRHHIEQQCSFDRMNQNVLHSYSCGMHDSLKLDWNKICVSDACVRTLFRSFKSEAFIKYDKYLSVIGIRREQLASINSSIYLAADRHSRYNPDVKQSFKEIAYSMDNLTITIAKSLNKSNTEECSYMKSLNGSIMTSQIQNLPGTVAEEVYRMIVLTGMHVSNNNNTLRNIMLFVQNIVAYPPMWSWIMPILLPYDIKNYRHRLSDKEKTRTTWKNDGKIYTLTMEGMLESIDRYGRLLGRILYNWQILRDNVQVMINQYAQLKFTQFIKHYSLPHEMGEYVSLLSTTLTVLHDVDVSLFAGKQFKELPFANYDEHIRTIGVASGNSLHVDHTREFPDVLRMTWMMLDKHIAHRTNPAYEAIYGYQSQLVKIPSVSYIICGLYNNFLEIAERYFGTNKAFSFLLSNSRFEPLHDHAVFVLDQLFATYDTSTLFDLEHDGLHGAERRACLNAERYPIHLRTNTTDPESEKAFHHVANSMRGGYNAHGTYGSRVDKAVVKLLFGYGTSILKFMKASKEFNTYFKDQIATRLSSTVVDVQQLRQVFSDLNTVSVTNQKHKRFLVRRLEDMSRLVAITLGDSGEDLISHFLDKKGTILIGEIQLEIDEQDRKLAKERAVYEAHYETIQKGLPVRQHSSMILHNDMLSAVLRAMFHTNVNQTRIIIDTMLRCTKSKWELAEYDIISSISNMRHWVLNATQLVRRAKRYVESTQISKNFLRKNIMHISLFYESIHVYDKTNTLVMPLKHLFSNVGSVAGIYMGTTILHVVLMFLFIVIEVFIRVVKIRILKSKVRRK